MSRSPRHQSSIIVATMLFVSMLLLGSHAPGAMGAGHTGAGVLLAADAPDIAFDVRSLAATICYVDSGSSGYSSGDPVILDISGSCGGDSSPGDLRLNRWSDDEPGQRLGGGNDANRPLTAPVSTASFYYYDGNGNSVLDAGDLVYANIVNPTKGTVEVGDIRITPLDDLPAGSIVKSGDSDLRFGLTLLGASSSVVALVDTDGDSAFDNQDLLYLNADAGGSELVEFGDVRLTRVSDDRPYGTIVTFGDADGSSLFTAATRSACHIDLDGSGGYGSADALVLDLDADCQGSTAAGDIRLSASEHGAAGTRIAVGDGDHGGAFTKMTVDVSYIDLDGDSRYDADETAFLDVVGRSDNTVDVGDVRLTPGSEAGGVTVTAGHPDLGKTVRDTSTFSSRVAFLSISGGTSPTPEDPVYINMDGGGGEGVEPGDIRVVPVKGAAYGGAAALGTGEVLPRIQSSSASICASTTDGSSTYRAGDPVYLAMRGGCSTVRAADIRLVDNAGHAGGSLVAGTDQDIGAGLITPTGSPRYKFFDADGDNEWSFADTLYIDMLATADDKVNVGDIRVTPFSDSPSFVAIAAGGSDLSLPLMDMGAISGRTVFVDGDGDNTFGIGDVAYVNQDNTGTYVTLLDVRLNALPEVATTTADDASTDDDAGDAGDPGDADDAGDDDAPGADDGADTDGSGDDSTGDGDSVAGGDSNGDADGGDAAGDGDDGDGDAVRTPGPAVVLVVAVLAGVLSVMRGRRR